jgi:hypothetical protein
VVTRKDCRKADATRPVDSAHAGREPETPDRLAALIGCDEAILYVIGGGPLLVTQGKRCAPYSLA